MRRLAQFVRLRASRVSRLASASVSRLRAFVSRASRVCVHLSRVRLASVCVCSRQGFRMRASASVSRRSSCLASVCVHLSRVSRLASASVSRLRAFVSRASRVCVHLSRVRLASVCVCSRQGFRMRASASCASVVLSRVCASASVSRLSRVCLASVVLSRVCASASVSRLSRVGRRSSCLASVCLLVNACGNWLILCRSSFKEFKRFFAIVILSLYI